MLINQFKRKVQKNELTRFQECLVIDAYGKAIAAYWCGGLGSDDPDDPCGFFVISNGKCVNVKDVYAWCNLASSNNDKSAEGRTSDVGIEIAADFHELKPGDEPANGAECLFILKDGRLAGGTCDVLDDQVAIPGIRGLFYKSSRTIPFLEVAKWLDLSEYRFDDENIRKFRDEYKKRQEEDHREEPKEPKKEGAFALGYHIAPYYDALLEKLRKEYPWAEKEQVLLDDDWYAIRKIEGEYRFVQYCIQPGGSLDRFVRSNIETVDEFIYAAEYKREVNIKNSNYSAKFKYGFDIDVYIEKVMKKLLKQYPWVKQDELAKALRFKIEKVGKFYQFVKYKTLEDGTEYRYAAEFISKANEFIDYAVNEYTEVINESNREIDSYEVTYRSLQQNIPSDWHLERYILYKLQSGDFKVYVQAGDRVTGGSRDFFVPATLKAGKSYDEFLDAYMQLVPSWGGSLSKEDLLQDENVKKFFGY